MYMHTGSFVTDSVYVSVVDAWSFLEVLLLTKFRVIIYKNTDLPNFENVGICCWSMIMNNFLLYESFGFNFLGIGKKLWTVLGLG